MRAEVAERRERARATRYMAGWDAAIRGEDGNANPYAREDYRAQWDKGFHDCMAGRPLPPWYDDWRGRKA